MKKHLVSGLAILLPIILTIMIMSIFVNFLTEPFLTSTQALLGQLDIFQHSFLFFHGKTLLILASKVFILLFLISFILLVGLFGKLFLINAFFRSGDYLLHKLPFINKIYKACQDVVHSLFSSSSKKCSQVVFVPFPNSTNLSIGFLTGNVIHLKNAPQENEDLMSVFIPGTPNPSVGFMLMFKREQLHFVNMKVDEAIKFIVSCGVIMPNFEIIQPSKDYEKHPFSQSDILSSEKQFSQDSIDLRQSAGSF